MYSNVGKKLCGYAKVLGTLGIIALVGSVFFMIAGLVDYYEWFVIGLIVIGSGLSILIFSFFIYAIGQITDDVHAMRVKIAGEEQQAIAYNVYPANAVPVYTNGTYPVYQNVVQPNVQPEVQQVYQAPASVPNQNPPV